MAGRKRVQTPVVIEKPGLGWRGVGGSARHAADLMAGIADSPKS